MFNGGRNIPAHAGKTPLTLDPDKDVPEHPRARGENFPACHQGVNFYGTSPRTRGKLETALFQPEYMRNIPAHAGKTRGLVQACDPVQEHPRARGENLVW